MGEETIVFSEVYVYINLLPKELKEKISNNFYSMIENNADKEYTSKILDDVKNFKLKKETEILIGMIYRDYLCENKDKFLESQNQDIDNESYYNKDTHKNFITNILTIEEIEVDDSKLESTNETSLILKEAKWYKSMLDKIIKFILRK